MAEDTSESLRLVEERRWSEAATALAPVVEREPRNAEAVLALARSYRALHDYDRAIQAYRAYLDLRPDDVTAQVRLAKILTKTGLHVEAGAMWRELAEIDVEDEATRLAKAQGLFYTGRPEESEALFRRLSGCLLPGGCFDAMRPLIRESVKLPGDLIECGVYLGGATVAMAKLIEGLGKKIQACDTYEGIPEPSPKDNFHKQGDFGNTSFRDVKARWDLEDVLDRIVPRIGMFKDTFPGMADNHYCFAFLDADFYVSMQEALDHVYPRISPGGWIVVDDYGASRCEGCKIAVDEFLEDKPEREDFERVFGDVWAFQKG